jgi:hypothetical protein
MTIIPLHLTDKWMKVSNGLTEDNFKYQIALFYSLDIKNYPSSNTSGTIKLIYPTYNIIYTSLIVVREAQNI